MAIQTISGKLIDLHRRATYPARVVWEDGKILGIEQAQDVPDQYILPGFVDAHVHIESSMLVPSAFARVASVHGTVATVSDPHEIANVCGVEGIRYMIEDSKKTPLRFFFGAPSCVPATGFETAGATIDSDAITQLLADEDIWYLAEMMNYPGVLFKDAEVMRKIAAAHAAGKPVDGHAPGLRGEDAQHYAAAGITTDHECFTLKEALGKVAAGMHILIREGSAARNFDALHELLRLHPERVMFCSDDKHPDELVVSHINRHVQRALALGYDMYDVLRAACLNPVQHYKLPVGLLREGDAADFIIVDSIAQFNVRQTYIAGRMVAEAGRSLLPKEEVEVINHFNALPRVVADFEVAIANEGSSIRVIEAIEGQLVTAEMHLPPLVKGGLIVSDTERDILKLAVINRYEEHAPIAIAFIKNFGLKYGALASTVAHDCHNIIAVGADDESLCAAVNALIEEKGGIAVADKSGVSCMPLPVGGLMSTADGQTVAKEYAEIDSKAKELGSGLQAPFMTLSFMALLVIPSLKLSDKGLFDGSAFQFTSLEI